MERRTNSEPNWTPRDLNPGRTDVFHNVVNCHRLRYFKAVISSLALCSIGTPEMTAHLKLARSLLDGSCMNWTLVTNIFSTKLEIITVSSLASRPLEPSGATVPFDGWNFRILASMSSPISTSTLILVRKVTEGDHSSIAHLGYRHRHVTF